MTGCIYKLSSELGNCCYIGKTCYTRRILRLYQHRYEFRIQRYYYSSFEVLKFPDVIFEIIKDDIPIRDLHMEERLEMKNHPNSVNIYLN